MVARIGAAVLATALVVSFRPALAHEEHALHALSVIERVYPSIDGIEIRVVHLDAPALVVTNDTDRVLTVLGEKGENFLQIGADGVRANAESPTTYVSGAPHRDVIPPGVKPNARPRWVTLSEESTWTWFDRRMRVDPNRISWAIPLMLGGQAIVVEGGYESLHGHGHFITQMEPPDIPGLEMRLTQGAIPAVFVRNETGKELVVPGDSGEPMLRIGPDGVFANQKSPTYFTSGATSILEVPESADAGARPRWKRVSDIPVWAWLERRAAVPAELHQRAELGDERRWVLEWTSRYRLGDEVVEVTGHVDWVPPGVPPGHVAVSSRTLLWLWISVAVVVVVATAIFMRRRARPAT